MSEELQEATCGSIDGNIGQDKVIYREGLDETPDCIRGVNVVVKFHLNSQSEKKNLITRTMGKVGLIKREWYQNNLDKIRPNHKELWRVRIIQEIFPGQKRGCFFVEPIERVLPIDIIKLVSGMYEEEEKNGIMFIKPNRDDLPFILPLVFKHSVVSNTCYASIVPLTKGEFTRV